MWSTHSSNKDALDFLFEKVILNYNTRMPSSIDSEAKLANSFYQLSKCLIQWFSLHYPKDLFEHEVRKNQIVTSEEMEIKRNKPTLSLILGSLKGSPENSQWAANIIKDFIERNNGIMTSLPNKLAAMILSFDGLIKKEMPRIPEKLETSLLQIYFLIALYEMNVMADHLIAEGADPLYDPLLLCMQETFNKAQEFLYNWKAGSFFNLTLFFEVRSWIQEIAEPEFCSLLHIKVLLRRLKAVCDRKNEDQLFMISFLALDRAIGKKGRTSDLGQLGVEILRSAREEMQTIQDPALVLHLAKSLMQAAKIIGNPLSYPIHAPIMWNNARELSSYSSRCKKTLGAFICLLMGAAMVASCLLIPATCGASGVFGLMLISDFLVGCSLVFGGAGFLSGIGLMIFGREKGTCAALRKLSTFQTSEEVRNASEVREEKTALVLS